MLTVTRLRTIRLSARTRAIADGIGILVFVTIGLLSHHGGISATGYARDALPFLGCWFAAAALFRLYTRAESWRLAATWALGVPVGVLIRALVLGRSLNGKEAAFLVVSLVTIGLLVPAMRLCARVLRSGPSPRRSARTQSPPAGS
ncbi:MAG TPA: DUF3054 domain-containing protein [Gaiellaceae bacterium]